MSPCQGRPARGAIPDRPGTGQLRGGAELAAAAAGVTLALLVPASVIASVYLVLAGHPPAGAAGGLVALTALAGLTGLFLSARGVTRIPDAVGGWRYAVRI
ncbi:hypothetical protein N864_23660 [Intrasporangium chromatireducens Q5-1]|uniref:Uncharacterized protein n=1 Tax=Intrasporangium chromatireducens Q5-1 TaxID=584657 RepID=W9GSG4_9MICO|nr:hypothetical protein [Intrasporangium chromatireducens]EWT07773.1 hypothetical protein N864_23660 [Intrasporangium chromatireducens Q5-1]